jgi:hypothetical protein
MVWTDDAQAMTAFDEMMVKIYPLVVNWMDSMKEHLGGDPNSVIIRLMAKSVHHYNVGRQKMNLTESEALGHTTSALTHDPELQSLMHNFGSMMMDKGAGLE